MCGSTKATLVLPKTLALPSLEVTTVAQTSQWTNHVVVQTLKNKVDREKALHYVKKLGTTKRTFLSLSSLGIS